MSKMGDLFIECAERLERLGFEWDEDVCRSALCGEVPKCSDSTIAFPLPDGRICYPVRDLTKKQMEHVMAVSAQYGIRVYHVLKTNNDELGITDAYLYVSLPMRDEACRRERQEIADKRPTVYMHRKERPELSGFCTIGVEQLGEFLARV